MKIKNIIIVTLTILLCSLIFYNSIYNIKAKNKEDITFKINFNINSNSKSKIITINSYYNPIDNKYYLFIPSYISLDEINIQHNYYKELYVNGKNFQMSILNDNFNYDREYIIYTKDKTDLCILSIMKSSFIPSLFINTESGNMNYINKAKENKESGNLTLLNSESEYFIYDLEYIKGRGNSTWLKDKRPYNIRFSKAIDILGTGKNKEYTLLSNSYDQSLIRNQIIFNLAKSINLENTISSQMVDLYLNGEYVGMYQLCEKIEINDNRIDITNLQKQSEILNYDLKLYKRDGDINSTQAGTKKWSNIKFNTDNITGGYLLEFEAPDRYVIESSGFVSDRGQCIVIKSPEIASKEEVDYISDFYSKLEEALYSQEKINSLGKHYSEYIDIDSFAKMYIIQEISLNPDAVTSSFYCYKDADINGNISKLKAGPVWDFDVALGNTESFWVDLTDPTVWFIKNLKIRDTEETNTYSNILAELIKDQEFIMKVKKIWNETINDIDMFLINNTDNYYLQYKKSAKMNFIVWNSLGEASNGVKTGDTYEENINYIKVFLNQRFKFLDEEFKYK